ncbi:MAG: S-layer homology domain-containing protein, partial [Bacillota bacterium]
LLMGAYPYTYTPIRFQLSKDSADNIYVKVYKVNQGSLDLPRLFYEIQSSDDPTIVGDWTVKKTIDDSFFAPGAESAITLISGVGPNNRIYYKIVVKTDTTSDRLESMSMYYILAEDTSKSPVPNGITVIGRDLVTRTVMINGQPVLQKSTDVTISWDKPANWDEIRANTDVDSDVVFQVLLNVNQAEVNIEPYPELKADGVLYGYFPLKYRRVLYFSSKSVKENGNRLEYTIKGFDLFKGKYFSGIGGDGNPVIVDETIDNPENYPAFLLPNKVYYMQMYTTNAVNRNTTELENMSDKSVIVSFTTRSAVEVDVPLPKNLRLNRNEADVTINDTTIVSNFIELQFDKVNVTWNNYMSDTTVSKAVYYDLYMSTRSDINSFRMIGSTQTLNGDLAFIGASDEQSTSIRVIIRNFSPDNPAYTLFGSKLRPNTTYYFVAKTRLSISGQSVDKESVSTAILSVTTVRGVIGIPDDSSKRPLAPTDFKIAEDEGGNLQVTGSRAVFSWSRQETDVVYDIICTSRRLETDEGPYDGAEDALYQSFRAVFADILLDPSLETLAENFEYNPVSRECKLTIDKWLFPNRLYYFSIRAIRRSDNTNYSSWVSIPVTTALIEQPALLEAVKDVQLGFFFNDEDLNVRTEDYNVYIKSENDLKYNFVTKDRYTMAKFGPTCYARLVNLKPNTSYDIKVYKNNDETLVFSREGMETRDGYHQIELKWRGLPGYKYELTVKTLYDNEYTVLADQNLEEYVNKDGRILPYYTEKNIKTSSTNQEYYFARIKTIPVKTADGYFEDVPLKSNTKYYVKVRAIKIDPIDPTIVSYSKYVGPVDIRTDFNQDDYDDEDMDTKKKASFLDRIRKFEEALYWRIDIGNGLSNKLLLKGDRMVNAIENNGPYPFTLDISRYAEGVSMDIIYVPVSVIEILDTDDKSLVIKTSGAEYTLRPGTIDTQNREVVELKSKSNINDIYYKFNINRLAKSSKVLPQGAKPLSKINDFSMDAVGTSITYMKLKEQINDRVYNKDSGLVQQKLKEFLSTSTKSTVTSKQLETVISKLIGDIEMELSLFLKNKIEGGNGSYPIVAGTKTIRDFNKPLMTKLTYTDEKGLKLPYVCYDGIEKWQKVLANTVHIANSILFNTIKTGEYSILLIEAASNDVPEDYPLSNDIKTLVSKYDLTEVFGSLKSFYPEDPVKVKEIILLYEKVVGKDIRSSGLTVMQKAQKYGLEDLISIGGVSREVKRQETAKVIMMVYSDKTGVYTDSLIPGRYIYISDEKDIESKNYKHVLMTVDLGVLNLDAKGAFAPNKPITRAELASAFVKLLKLTGDV